MNSLPNIKTHSAQTPHYAGVCESFECSSTSEDLHSEHKIVAEAP